MHVCALSLYVVLSFFQMGVSYNRAIEMINPDNTPPINESDFLHHCSLCKEISIDGGGANCTHLWQLFDIAQSITFDFRPYIWTIPPRPAAGSPLLFSGTGHVIKYVAGREEKQYYSSFQTCCVGARVQGGTWFNNASDAFFAQSSAAVAMSARGEIQTFVSATSTDPTKVACPPADLCHSAYRNDSFFATAELPSMNSTYVSKITALVVPYGYERCGQGSLVQMEETVRAHGLGFDCVDVETPQVDGLCEFVSYPSPGVCTNFVDASPVFAFDLWWCIIAAGAFVVGGIVFGAVGAVVATKKYKKKNTPSFSVNDLELKA